MSEPSKLQFVTAKMILRYVKRMKNFGVLYQENKDNQLVEYTDSDRAGFFMWKNIISW